MTVELPAARAAPVVGAHRHRKRWSLRRVYDLLVFRTYADLRAEVERTYLGFIWWVLEPLMFMLVFYFVFGTMRGNSGSAYVAMLLVGLVFWQWIKSGISHATDSINNSLFLMRQVYVPAALVPLMVVVTDSVKFLFVLLVLVVTLVLMGYTPGVTWLQLPLILLVCVTFILGVGSLVAVWCPLFPDLRFVVETVLLLLMFMSGVFFGRDEIPANMQDWFFLNPIAVIIDSARQVMLHGQWAALDQLAIAFLEGLALCAIAAWCAGLLQRRYPKLSV